MRLGLAVFLAVVGLVLGSFANVPIQRWPRGATISAPRRSACPSCGVAIRPWDNIPVLSWIMLKGRCRHCDASISARYLVVEIMAGGLFAALAWSWGPDPLLPALLVLTWALIVATAIDLEFRIIPNRLTYRLPLVLFPLVTGAAWADGAWTDLRRALITAVALPAVMFLLSEAFRLLRGQPGIGMGDIKLAASLGMVVGYLGGLEIVVFAYGAVISAVFIALVLMIMGKARLASRIPFGPYLAIGAMLVVLAGDPLVALVREWIGLGPS